MFSYIASPYSHPDEVVQFTRYREALRFTQWCLSRKLWVYSPIVHCHELAVSYSMPKDAAFWKEYNEEMLRCADAVFVLRIAGTTESKGVAHEIDFALKLKKPVDFFTKCPDGNYESAMLST